MKEILREETAFNGSTVRLEYDSFDFGDKYKIRFKRPGEYGFRYVVSCGTAGEANDYFNKMIGGGM